MILPLQVSTLIQLNVFHYSTKFSFIFAPQIAALQIVNMRERFWCCKINFLYILNLLGNSQNKLERRKSQHHSSKRRGDNCSLTFGLRIISFKRQKILLFSTLWQFRCEATHKQSWLFAKRGEFKQWRTNTNVELCCDQTKRETIKNRTRLY